MENDKIQFRNALAKAHTETDTFKEQLRIQSERESVLVTKIEKLKQELIKIRSQIDSKHTG